MKKSVFLFVASFFHLFSLSQEVKLVGNDTICLNSLEYFEIQNQTKFESIEWNIKSGSIASQKNNGVWVLFDKNKDNYSIEASIKKSKKKQSILIQKKLIPLQPKVNLLGENKPEVNNTYTYSCDYLAADDYIWEIFPSYCGTIVRKSGNGVTILWHPSLSNKASLRLQLRKCNTIYYKETFITFPETPEIQINTSSKKVSNSSIAFELTSTKPFIYELGTIDFGDGSIEQILTGTFTTPQTFEHRYHCEYGVGNRDVIVTFYNINNSNINITSIQTIKLEKGACNLPDLPTIHFKPNINYNLIKGVYEVTFFNHCNFDSSKTPIEEIVIDYSNSTKTIPYCSEFTLPFNPGQYTLAIGLKQLDKIEKQKIILDLPEVSIPKFNPDFVQTTEGEPITFTPVSTDKGLFYYWEFGDGSYSNLKEPTKSFSTDKQALSYKNVTLTVTNPYGYAKSFSYTGDEVKITRLQLQGQLLLEDDGTLLFSCFDTLPEDLVFVWFMGNKQVAQTKTPFYKPEKEGNFWLKIISGNGTLTIPDGIYFLKK